MELEKIEALLKLMQEYGVAELGIEEDNSAVHLRLMEAAVPGAAPAPVAAVAVPAASAPAAAPVAAASNFAEVKSPMVGTFYRSPKPESPSFVRWGIG